MWRRLALVAVLAACRKEPAPAADCTHAGDGVAAFWTKQLASAPSDAERGYAQKMLEIAPARLVRHCNADHWSAAAAECARTDTDRCKPLLTPAQQDQLRTDPEAQMITRYEPIQMPPPCELEPLVIEVADGSERIGLRGGASCSRTRAALEDELRRVVAHAGGCSVPVEITARPRVAYEQIIAVMDMAVNNGLTSVMLTTETLPGATDVAECPLPGGRHDARPSVSEAAGSGALKQAPVIVVTTEAIELRGQKLASLADAKRGSGPIAALAHALPAHPADPTIILQADRSTDSAVIERIVETTQTAGYDNLLFAVKQQER